MAWPLSTDDDGESWLESLRQPEYVGENRCVPCTLVNVVLAVAIGVGIGAVVTVGEASTITAGTMGVGATVAGLVAIYLRGYLVPHTPTLTKQYMPEQVLEWFDKVPAENRDLEETALVDVESKLQQMDVLTQCPRRDDLCLDDAFRTAWESRIESLDEQAVEEMTVARLLEVDSSDRISLTHYGEAALVRIDGRQVGQWESTAALRADIAADQVLRDRYDTWQEIDVLNRSRILNSLRMFVEHCPSCGDPVAIDQDVVESCCRTMDVAAVSCDACGARIFEIELTDELKAQL